MHAGLLKIGLFLLLGLGMAVGPVASAAQAGQMASAMQAAGDLHNDPADPCAASVFDCADNCAEMSQSDCAISCAANCTMSASANLLSVHGPVFPATLKFAFDLPTTAPNGPVAIEPYPPRDSITL